MPSICHTGRNRLGYNSGDRPNTLRRPPIHPRALSRCTMCVYSCAKTIRSQSSVLPMVLSPEGAAAVISIRL